MSWPPSGAQFEIAAGGHRATVVEVGAGIRTYTHHNRPVLDGYPPNQICSGARGTPLIPWPNRIADGTYTFEGTRYQLPLTEPATHTAIHGLTRWRNWGLREHGEDRVVLGTVLHPQPGYPFTLHLTIGYHLHDPHHPDNRYPRADERDEDQTACAGLTVATTATNFGDTACPYATGAHPYLTVGTDHIDECELHLAATHWLPTDERGLPTTTAAVAGSRYDFSVPRPIAHAVIDNAFTGLARDADGRAWLSLTGPDQRIVRLWVDSHYRYLEVYTGDTQPPEQRRRGLGVEPMTCPPNGLATGQDVLSLAPGESLTTRWGIHPD